MYPHLSITRTIGENMTSEALAVHNLDKEVAGLVSKGYKVEDRSATQVILSRKKVNWWLHVFLSVITGGIWLIVLAVKILKSPKRVTLTVDPSGRVIRR